MNIVRRILWVVLMLLLIDTPASVRADIAPPEQPPGSNPEPGSEMTQVRMVSETVLLDVQASTPQNNLGQALVSADFTMRNTGTAAESMAVRFPLGSDTGFGEMRELRNWNVKVNGTTVSSRRIMQVNPVWGSNLVPWAEFDVTFPPGQDVNIQVSYLLDATGEYPFISFNYIFHTGAGWKDTIGSADLVVRMPYNANPQNVLFDENTGWSTTTPGGVIAGREIRWRFENFEPEISNDFEVSLVSPSAWQTVLLEQSNLNRNPTDGESWGRLGKLYKEILFFRRGFRHDAGGQELYSLSVAAYDKALTHLPDDALWQAGFADLLATHAFYAMQDGQDMRGEILISMEWIHSAQQRAPNDPKVREIAEKIYFFFPEAIEQLESGYNYLWLTTTPELLTPTTAPVEATLTFPPATKTPLATPTALPAQQATATPEPSSASNPLCAPAFLLPLGLILFARSKNML